MPVARYADHWADHKDDLQVWRRFWALWELRRKWNWADWFFKKVRRTSDDKVTEPDAWFLLSDDGYMILCLWIALLRSVHEGITEGLDDPYDTLKSERMEITKVLPKIPENIMEFPSIPGTPFRVFRNAIFHCQWTPVLSKFNLDQVTVTKIEALHKEMGSWLNREFQASYWEFVKKYSSPQDWLFNPDGTEVMPWAFF